MINLMIIMIKATCLKNKNWLQILPHSPPDDKTLKK